MWLEGRGVGEAVFLGGGAEVGALMMMMMMMMAFCWQTTGRARDGGAHSSACCLGTEKTRR